jgi:hypothetical protein
MYYNFRRNPHYFPTSSISKAERITYKRYLLLERFFNALSIATLRDIADTWVDPTLKTIKSKEVLIKALLDDNDLVKRAVVPARSDGTVLFTLKHLATEKEVDKLLKLLNISRKSNDTLTHNAILESLKLVVTAPLSGVAAYREEAIQWRKGKALEKARGIRSQKAAKKRKVVERQQTKERTQKEATRARKERALAKIADARRKKQEAKAAKRAKREQAVERARREKQEAKAAKRVKREHAAEKARREKQKARIAVREKKLRVAARVVAKAKKEREKARAAKIKAAERAAAKEKKARGLVRAEARNKPALAIVTDFIAEVEKAAYFGKRLGMKAYAQMKGIHDYVGFTRKVKKHRAEVAKQAHMLFLQWKNAHEEALYRQHVIDYLAFSEFRKAEGRLTKKSFVEEKGLDYNIFSDYYAKFRHDATVQDEANIMFLELETGRLSDLRSPPKVDPIEALFIAPKPKAKLPDLILLERLAKEKLPVKKGLPVFSDDPRENNAQMELWLAIADDVMQVGLISAVAEKYLHEFGLPPAITTEQQIKLVLVRMRTILEQLDVFDPRKEHLTFARLRAWKEERDAKKAKKAERLAEKALIQEPVPELTLEPAPELESMSDEEIYDEAWLEAEVAREEAEERRYLTTEEEKERRRSEGLVYSGTLPRSKIEELKQLGAIYDNNEWLLPDNTILEELQMEFEPTPTGLAGWNETRKPRLLIGLFVSDLTTNWMKKSFDLRKTIDPAKVEGLIAEFEPDALVVYSKMRAMQKAFLTASTKHGLPLLTFEKGMSGAVLLAQEQGLDWFVDAFNKKRTMRRLLRRYNPYYRVRRNPYKPHPHHSACDCKDCIELQEDMKFADEYVDFRASWGCPSSLKLVAKKLSDEVAAHIHECDECRIQRIHMLRAMKAFDDRLESRYDDRNSQ